MKKKNTSTCPATFKIYIRDEINEEKKRKKGENPNMLNKYSSFTR